MIAVGTPFHAVGNGRDVAMGALDSLNKTKRAPETILKDALNTVEKYNAFVRPPLVFVNT